MKKILVAVILLLVTINANAKSLNCNYTMSEGSYGDNVKILQKLLNQKTNCNLEIDGSFGPKTKACVKKYQRSNNLTVDGVVGINTCSSLKGVKVSSSNDKIIVDISEQKLYFYKNGNKVLTAKVITGMKNKHDTPKGTYTLYPGNKGRSTTLRGYNDDGSKYSAYVEYWMPFYGGYGFHDADGWRSYDEYNTSTYKYNGSHGCINMKRPDAKTLYNNLNNTTTVIIRK